MLLRCDLGVALVQIRHLLKQNQPNTFTVRDSQCMLTLYYKSDRIGVIMKQYFKHKITGKIERYPERYGRLFKDVDRKSTRLNSSHVAISYAVFCLKKKKRK